MGSVKESSLLPLSLITAVIAVTGLTVGGVYLSSTAGHSKGPEFSYKEVLSRHRSRRHWTRGFLRNRTLTRSSLDLPIARPRLQKKGTVPLLVVNAPRTMVLPFAGP